MVAGFVDLERQARPETPGSSHLRGLYCLADHLSAGRLVAQRVKAHAGHPWNKRADALVAFARLSGSHFPGPPEVCSDRLAMAAARSHLEAQLGAADYGVIVFQETKQPMLSTGHYLEVASDHQAHLGVATLDAQSFVC